MAFSEDSNNGTIWNNMRTPKVKDRLSELYETQKWHDCVFKLWNSDGSEEELVFAHRLILASSSPVFEALCFGPLAEDNTIELPDIDPMAFKIMLKFIYTDYVDLNCAEMACNVLYASKKYLIYSLAALSISYILHHLNETNCLQVYNFASFIHEDQLIKGSWKYLCSHLDLISNYVTHESLTFDLVKNLVNEEALNGDELILFKICLMWAESECDKNNLERSNANLRKFLIQGDLLSKIRWLALSSIEFEEGPQRSGILTNEEVTFITDSTKFFNHICLDCESLTDASLKACGLTFFNTNPDCNVDLKKKMRVGSKLLPFNVSLNYRPRKQIQLNKVYCHRFIEKEDFKRISFQNNLKINTYIIFNKSVKLTAIILPAQYLPRTHFSYFPEDSIVGYNEKLLVSICDNNGKLLFSTAFYERVLYGREFKIALPKPVILERCKEYTIHLDLLHSPEKYVFLERNSILKFPSGLCVTFREEANIGENESYHEVKDFGVICGIELWL